MSRWIVATRADSVQCAIFDGRRVTLAHARNTDDGFGDYFSYWVISVYEAEIEQCGLISRRHRLNFCRSEGAVGDQPIDCHGASSPTSFRGVAGKSHDKAFVVPNFDRASVRLRERLFDDFLIVSTFGDFDVCKVAVPADGVDAICDHDATPELVVPAVTFRCRVGS